MLDRTVAAFIYTNNMLDRGDQTRKGSDNALGQKLLESVKSISKGELGVSRNSVSIYCL